MARVNRSFSVPEDLSAQIDAAAAAEGLTPSAWLAETARNRLICEQGVRDMSEWLDENGGPATPEEDAWAREAVARAMAANANFRRQQAARAAEQEHTELAS